MLPMLKEAASVPPSVYVKSSPSGSVAVMALPIFVFAAVFSAIVCVTLSPENTGVSLTSMTLIVTTMLSVLLPSLTVTDTS